MAAQNICFYSNNCDWSKAFLKELALTSFKSKFVFVCVDKDANGKRPTLPDWVKKVPTLFIKGDPEPVKTDAEVMNWLYMNKLRSGEGAEGGAQTSLEPDAYMSHEMGGGIQDAYGFVDQRADRIVHDDNTISTHNFASTNFEMLHGPGVRTSSEIPGGQGQGQGEGRKSNKAELFDKQLQDFQKQRNVGIPQGRPRQ